ncbi:aspartate dehydrogenase [Sedimentitalea nanhaiensis]|uniref:L-aspartate dehydrogenase n=1 Tax=Sedimentitalea nanhaiensis TaxID=999627 RepID=A0A1I7EB55_9RHOB|nr:aspartate dehydrogenase [Sedimentitalea nanhaiensis]SFU21122.1 aspartate dehydrogenase [Sedimentitalea nanhaiensis]
MQHLALIGFGAIGQTLLQAICDYPGGAPERLSLLVRPGAADRTRLLAEGIGAGQIGQIDITTDIADLLVAMPDLVVECAGHQAVAEFGPRVLDAGTSLVVASIGALGDDVLFQLLRDAAEKTSAQIILPAGAIGGVDALAAARLSGLQGVIYTGRKPPSAWKGTEAEQRLDLDALTQEAVFFEGSARQAAKAFPKNANVAATLALAGVGMDATRVRLIADPQVTANIHEYEVRSAAVDYSVRLIGKASPLNPKTSLSTAFSLARTILNRSDAIVI